MSHHFYNIAVAHLEDTKKIEGLKSQLTDQSLGCSNDLFFLELHKFQEQIKYYINTGEGDTQEFFKFIEKNRLDFHILFQSFPSSSPSAAQNFLNQTFVSGSPTYNYDKPKTEQIINMERADTCFEIMSDLLKGPAHDTIKPEIAIFLRSCIFNSYRKNRDKNWLGCAQNFEIQHYNLYIALSKITEFFKKENMEVRSDFLPYLNLQFADYLDNYSRFLIDNGQKTIKPKSLEVISHIVQLYGVEILKSDTTLLSHFKEEINKDADALNNWPSLIYTVEATIDKISLSHNVAQVSQSSKHTNKLKI